MEHVPSWVAICSRNLFREVSSDETQAIGKFHGLVSVLIVILNNVWAFQGHALGGRRLLDAGTQQVAMPTTDMPDPVEPREINAVEQARKHSRFPSQVFAQRSVSGLGGAARTENKIIQNRVNFFRSERVI